MNYQKLRELRNQLLHDGTPPLEFGCEVNDGDLFIHAEAEMFGNEIAHVYNPKDKESGSIAACYIDGENGERRLEKIEDLIESGEFKILGTPVTIANILVMLQKVPVSYSVKADQLCIDDMGGYCMYIDLLKPISEQENVCKELMDLLSNK